MNDLKNKVIEEIKKIYDPEIPVNIYDLGLIYDIKVEDKNTAKIKMTLTSPNCPVAESLPKEVKDGIMQVEGIENVDLDSETLDIYMVNSDPVGGWQFELPGITVIEASAPAGFISNTSPTTVLAFSLSGATIPSGNTILVTVNFDSSEDVICFGSAILSDASGSPYDVDASNCIWGSIHFCRPSATIIHGRMAQNCSQI